MLENNGSEDAGLEEKNARPEMEGVPEMGSSRAANLHYCPTDSYHMKH